MSRLLMQYGVGQLEEMFAKSKADPEVLKQLESELRYRQVPRAVALLTEVQASMYSATAIAGAEMAPPPAAQEAMPASKQPRLFEHSEAPTTGDMQSPVAVQPRPPSTTPQRLKSQTPMAIAIPVDDAYNLLKATPGSTWESIEQTRRLIVQQSHPSRVATLSAEKRAQAEAEAAQANVAYLKLSTVRCHE